MIADQYIEDAQYWYQKAKELLDHHNRTLAIEALEYAKTAAQIAQAICTVQTAGAAMKVFANADPIPRRFPPNPG